jgi:hypothetical protein
VNIALGKPASQSSVYNTTWNANKGNDGNADSTITNNHCFHTKNNTSPWWEVDLQAVYTISQVNITNSDTDCMLLFLSYYRYYTTVHNNKRYIRVLISWRQLINKFFKKVRSIIEPYKQPYELTYLSS